MKSYRKELWFKVPTRRAFINITSDVQQCIDESCIKEGLVLVNAMHITASVFINDDESGLHHDYEVWLEKLAPEKPHSQYQHNGYEDNADAHHKRQVMGREVVVAVTEGKLLLVSFTGHLCVTCRMMERDVFRRPAVAGLLAPRFVESRLHLGALCIGNSTNPPVLKQPEGNRNQAQDQGQNDGGERPAGEDSHDTIIEHAVRVVLVAVLNHICLCRAVVGVGVPRAGNRSKYMKSGLNDAQLLEYKHRLEHIMSSEQIFLRSDLTLPKLASLVNCSVNHLSQVINAGFGMSFFDYINRHRIDHARHLLAQRSGPPDAILNIAFSVGFNSNSAFYAAFKKCVGMTPAQFRREQRRQRH